MATKTKEIDNGTTEKQVSAEQARMAIIRERRQREQNAMEGINKVLQETNCRLLPVAIVKGNSVVQSVEIIAND